MHAGNERAVVGGVSAWLAALPVVVGLLFSAAAADPGAAMSVAKLSPEEAKEAYEAAKLQFQKNLSIMMVVQSEYQKPGANKKALEARFDSAKADTQTASDAFEKAALSLLVNDPGNDEANTMSAAIVGMTLKTDEPEKGIALTEMLDAAGVADGFILFCGAQCARKLAEFDKAEAFLQKAKQASGEKPGGMPEFTNMLEKERQQFNDELAKRASEAAADDLPRIRLETSKGPIVIELFENEAPNTVANFIALVERGFYNGTKFHRVIGGFMAQGGDPTGTGGGGPGYSVPCETEVPGARKHFLGSLSMAHAGKDTGGSQFFLTFGPVEHLDGKHTVFGRIIEGLEVLPKLLRTQTPEGQPLVGIVPDGIVKAEVIRKRDHAYIPNTLPK